MKKILAITLAVLLMAGTAFAYITPGYRLGPGSGDIMCQGKLPQEPHGTYRLVRYITAAGATGNEPYLSADALVVWSLTADDGVTVSTTNKSFDNSVAGIIKQNAATPDVRWRTATQDVGLRNWTWLQTYGMAHCQMAEGADGIITNDGTAFGTSTAYGYGAGGLDYDSESLKGNTIGKYAGFTMNAMSSTTTAAAASGTKVKVFLTCE